MYKRQAIFVLMLLICSTPVFAQFNSPYLETPELNIGYVDSCAQFWVGAWDIANGGFYSDVDRQGNVTGTNKYTLTQSRNIYGLMRAYMMTGFEDYLDIARDAVNWMNLHCWDSTYGGWYNQISETGNPVNPTSTKSAFDQHYALLGLAAYYEVTRDTTILSKLIEGYNYLENVYWDDREGYEGYYDVADYDGSNPRNKSFNATVDAITTHLLLLQLMTNEEQYFVRLNQLGDNIIDHLAGSMPQQAIGFVEEYDSDWNWNNNDTMTIMGHVLKAAWCLGRIYRIGAHTECLDDARSLFYEVVDNGYDHYFGGPYKDYNRVTGEMLMWGNPDTCKAWWQMEQAITAGLELNDLLAIIDPENSGEPYQIADESSQFFMENFVDHEYGEVYENRTRYGEETWGTTKGNGYKAAYHSTETGYYSYLYGNLFAHGELTPLYYNIEPTNEDRSFNMTPVAANNSNIWIESVTLEGENYENFSSTYQQLYVAADIGGTFIVTYGHNYLEAPEIKDINLLPSDLSIKSVYPNPFNSQTNLAFDLFKPGLVDIAVYNINGQLVNKNKQQYYSTGRHSVPFDFSGFASGNYVISVQAAQTRQSTRILLVK